jgi:hypothetical protein
MKLIRSSVLVIVLLAVTAVPTLAGAVPVVTNQVVPFSRSIQVPCANGGAGENVVFSGEGHEVIVQVPNEAGGTTSIVHYNLMGITGVGETTRTRYHMQGASQALETSQAVGADTLSFTYNLRLVAAGPGNDLSTHVLMQFRIKPDGTTVVLMDITEITCN